MEVGQWGGVVGGTGAILGNLKVLFDACGGL